MHLLKIIFVAFALLPLVAFCDITFRATDPSTVQTVSNTLSLTWTSIDNASLYDVEWDFLGNFERLATTFNTHIELSHIPHGVPINYRVYTLTDSGRVTSGTTAFTMEENAINSTQAVDALSPPSLSEVDATHVLVYWEQFGIGGPEAEYQLQVFGDGSFTTIAVAFTELLGVAEQSITLVVPSGVPFFYRISRGAASTPSTVFATSDAQADGSFSSTLGTTNIQTIEPTDATVVVDLTSTPEGAVSQWTLSEENGGRGLVRYDLSDIATLSLCSFKYARLVFDLEEANLGRISNHEADGGFIRAYGSLSDSWAESSTTVSNAPKPTDEGLYLASTQIVQLEEPPTDREGNPVLYATLDRTLTGAGTMLELLNQWRTSLTGNDGLLVTFTGSLTAEVTLPVPKLEIVSDAAEVNSDVAAATIEFGNVPATQPGTGDECSFQCEGPSSGSVCSFDAAWQNGERQLPSGLVPPGAIVMSMIITINGGLGAVNAERLTVSVSGSAVADQFAFTGAAVSCSATGDDGCSTVAVLKSPLYSVETGGWPNFDTVDTGNNILKIAYSGEICVGSVDVEIEYVTDPSDPNCPTPSPSPTTTPTPTPSLSVGASPSTTPSFSQTPTTSPSASRTPSASRSTSASRTTSQSPSRTPPPSFSASRSVTPSQSSSPSSTLLPTIIGPSPVPQPSQSSAPSGSPTPAPSQTRTPSPVSFCVMNPSLCAEDDVDVVVDEGDVSIEDDDSAVEVPAGTFPPGTVVVVAQPPCINRDPILGSCIVEVVAFDPEGGSVQPDGSVEICLRPESQDENQCLGFLDTSQEPPVWRCEDKCPSKASNGLICGRTDHFTNFALLLGSVGGDECDSNNGQQLIFDRAWKDGVLVGSVTVGICCICLIILVLLVTVPGTQRLLYGSEGMRVRAIRSHQATAARTVTHNTPSEMEEEML